MTKGGLRVLLLEDSPSDEELTRDLLSRLRPPPKLAAAGRLVDALTLLREQPFDVVLTDLNLPDSQGVETIQRIAAVKPDLPIVALTGSFNEENGIRAVEAGADDYLLKWTCDGREILRTLEFAVTRRGLHSTKAEKRLHTLVRERTARLQEALQELGARDAALQVTNERLIEAKSRLDLVANSVSDVIWLIALEPLQTLYINAAYSAVFGRSMSLIEQNAADWLEAVHPDDLLRMKEEFEGLSRRDGSVHSFEFRVVRPDGIVRDVAARLTLIRDANGATTHVAGVARDISDSVALHEAEKRAFTAEQERENLEQQSRFKSSFLNMAAHDLATPLTPIKLQLYLLRSAIGTPIPAGAARALEILDRNVVRMGGLIQDLLDVGRIEARRLELRTERTDVAALAKEVVDTFADQAQKNRTTLLLHCEEPCVTECDPRRISQVLLNLVSNGLKFTPKGGRVSIRLGSSGQDLCVTVQDSGRGISSQDIKNMFQPFSRVGDTKAIPGNGVGLYICKGLVEAHGGQIWVDSPGPDAGTVVGFTLPLTNAARTSDTVGSGTQGVPASVPQ